MIRLLSSVSIFLVATLTLIGCASGPPALIPWFDEQIHIGTVDLSEGVSLQVVKKEWMYFSSDELYVANESATPVYFAEFPSVPGIIVSPTPAPELTPPISPTIKVVSGIAYEWGNVPGVTPALVGWNKISKGFDEPRGLKCHIWGSLLECENTIVLEITAVNQFGYGGDRPENPEIPAPQNADLILFYDIVPFHVPLQISYSLNTAYPTSPPGIDLEQLLSTVLGPSVFCVLFGVSIGVLLLIAKLIIPARKS